MAAKSKPVASDSVPATKEPPAIMSVDAETGEIFTASNEYAVMLKTAYGPPSVESYDDFWQWRDTQRRNYVDKVSKQELARAGTPFNIYEVQIGESPQYGVRWELRTDIDFVMSTKAVDGGPVWLTMSFGEHRDRVMEMLARAIASTGHPVPARLTEGFAKSGYRFYDIDRPRADKPAPSPQQPLFDMEG